MADLSGDGLHPQQGSTQVVTAPVTVRVGAVDLRLYPYNEVQSAPDDFDCRPWKWWAMVRLHFRIGELTTSKRVISRYSYHGPGAWPTESRPSDAALAAGRQAVLDNLREQVARHGIEPPDFLVIESDEAALVGSNEQHPTPDAVPPGRVSRTRSLPGAGPASSPGVLP